MPALLCLLLTVVYVVRWRNARATGGPRGVEWWRLALWLGGVVTLAAALVSPIDTEAERSFSMHMIQHVLLLDVAPILLICGLSKVLLRPIARTVLEVERSLGPVSHPAFAVVAYAALMWLWHVPALYDAALEHSGVHVLEHVCFMSAGILYWWHLLSPVRSRHLKGLAPVAYMASTKVLVGLLGILLIFSPELLYDFYVRQDRLWGLSPLTDQSVGGAIMAIEQSLVMGIALAYLFVRALEESDREDERAERYGKV